MVGRELGVYNLTDAHRLPGTAPSGTRRDGPDSRLGPYLEDRPRPVETNVKLQEEVDLPQDDRNVIGLRPGKGQSHRGEAAYHRRHYNDACLDGRQVAGQRDRTVLPSPVEAELFTQGIR